MSLHSSQNNDTSKISFKDEILSVLSIKRSDEHNPGISLLASNLCYKQTTKTHIQHHPLTGHPSSPPPTPPFTNLTTPTIAIDIDINTSSSTLIITETPTIHLTIPTNQPKNTPSANSYAFLILPRK